MPIWTDHFSKRQISDPPLFLFISLDFRILMNLPIKNSLGKFHGSAALVDYKWFSVLKIWSHLVVVANKTMFPSISSRITARLWNTQDTSVILWSSLVLFIPNQTQRKRALHIIYMYIYIFHLVFSSLSIWIQILFYFWHHLLCFQRSRFTNCFSNLSIASKFASISKDWMHQLLFQWPFVKCVCISICI